MRNTIGTMKTCSVHSLTFDYKTVVTCCEINPLNTMGVGPNPYPPGLHLALPQPHDCYLHHDYKVGHHANRVETF